jgi:predicted Zn-dependent protease with MMP-like domain
MKQMDSACRPAEERKMERDKFVKLVEEALDALPTRFRKQIHNFTVLVENLPPERLPHSGSRNAGVVDSDDAENLVLGVFEGVPTTMKQRSPFSPCLQCCIFEDALMELRRDSWRSTPNPRSSWRRTNDGDTALRHVVPLTIPLHIVADGHIIRYDHVLIENRMPNSAPPSDEAIL